MDANAWYYASGSEHKGPVSADQMSSLCSSGAVSGETLVWMQKLPDWTPLRETILAPLLATTALGSAPPPLGSRVPPAGLIPGPGPQTLVDPRPGPSGEADFITIIRYCFAKFVTWRGRADRPEFWYFFLFTLGVSTVASIFDAVLFHRTGEASVGLFGPLVNLICFLPSLAVSVRRLHDTDHSAWWLFMYAVPLAGIIVMIVFFCRQGTPGMNRYGEHPGRRSVAEVF